MIQKVMELDAHTLFKQLTCGATFSANHKTSHEATKNVLNGKSTGQLNKNEFSSSNASLKTASNQDQSLELLNGVKSVSKRSDKNIPISTDKLELLETERINHLRNIHHINVTGENPPHPIETFEQLNTEYKVAQTVVDNLLSSYRLPTPIQMQAMSCMLSGKSILACAPTGSGKTISFLVPIIRDLKKPRQKGFRAIILCPTRELAKQTQRECLKLVEDIGLRVHIASKTNKAEHRYGEKSNQNFDILITTPKRICFLLEQNPPVLNLANVKWLILDEADKLFEESANSFRDQFDQIYSACTNPKKKVGLFSATLTNAVAKWRRKNLKKSFTIIIGQRNSATNLIDQQLKFVGSEPGKLLAFRELIHQKGLKPPALVFVESKERAQQLYSELKSDNVKIGVIHSDLTQQQRDDVVKSFREGNIWILICTEIISRGIDFKGVNLVVNYDFPPTAISYIHRIGRTGRAGRQGQAVTYFTQSDSIILKSIANVMKNSGCPVPEYMLAMKDRSKREKMRLAKNKEKREDICRSHTYGVAAARTMTKKPMLKKRIVKNVDDAAQSKTNFVSLKRPKINQMQNGKSKKIKQK